MTGTPGRARASAARMISSAARSASVTGDVVVLRFDLEAAPDDLEDRLARFARGLGEIVEESRVIHAQRGAIRIPPSRRTDAAFM